MSNLIKAIDPSNILYIHYESKDGPTNIVLTSLGNEFTSRTKIALASLEFTNFLYNITSSLNLCIQEINGTTNPNNLVTISPGFWSTDTLPTQLQTLLNTGSPNSWVYTVTFNATTGTITIAASGNTIKYLYSLSTLNEQIGLPSNADVTGTPSIVCPHFVNLLSELAVYVTADVVDQSYMNNVARSNVLEKVPLDADFGTVMFYQHELANMQFLPIKKKQTTINIKLTDSAGNVLPVSTNKPWSLTLALL